MKTILRLNHLLGKAEYAILAAAILIMAVLLILNAVGRSVFNQSIQATEELCQVLVLTVTFIGLSNAARFGKHVVMTAIYDLLSPRSKRMANIFINTLTFLFMAFVFYLSLSYVMKVYTYGRITSVLGIPMYLVLAIMPLGCALGAIQYLITGILSVMHKDIIYVGTEKVEEHEVSTSQLQGEAITGGEIR